MTTHPPDAPRRLLSIWSDRLARSPDEAAAMREADRRFAFKLSPHMAARLAALAPSDPLVRQFVPSPDELVLREGFVSDPVGDLAVQPVPGLLRKYEGRALLITTGACPVHCRYCFRREYPYDEASAVRDDLAPALDAIARDATLSEVILSGGDPLMLSNDRLSKLLSTLDAVSHVRRVRVHTRVPTTAPDRIDDALLHIVGATRLAPLVIVLHTNHPDEIDAAAASAIARLRAKGAVLLNQSVLLAGVNDHVDVLVALSERLLAVGVVPYYLHLLDRVRGASHFEVPEARAVALIDALIERLPGYLVPRLVRETAGAPSKLHVARVSAPLAR